MASKQAHLWVTCTLRTSITIVVGLNILPTPNINAKIRKPMDTCDRTQTKHA